jgi:hypothetical protein
METVREIARAADRKRGAPVRTPLPAPAPAHPLLALQQQAGNQAVQQFLRANGIHAKLAISQPDDPEEHEADNIADRVMRAHAGSPIGSSCSCASGADMCEGCKQKQNGIVARKSASARAVQPVVRDATENEHPSCGKNGDIGLRASASLSCDDDQQKTNLPPSMYGRTDCKFPGGAVPTIYTSGCNKPCIELHENVHVNDIKPCCTQANVEYFLAPDDAAKQKIKSIWCDWQKAILSATECHAYSASNPCLDRAKTENHCDKATLTPAERECCGEINLARQDGEAGSRGCPAVLPEFPPCPFGPSGPKLMRSSGIQAKLAISQPGDPEEHEADRVADRVMRAHAGAPIGSSCSCAAGGEECEECRQKQGATIARKAANAEPPAAPHRPVEPVVRSSGDQLDPSTRAFFEPRFGRDFSNVRVHTDSAAASSARAIDALAYTTSNHIVFRQGLFEPNTEAGQRLIAHELTHVIQQGSASRPQTESAHRLDRKPQGAASFPIPAIAEKPQSIVLQRYKCESGKAPGMSCTDVQGTGHPAGVHVDRFGESDRALLPRHVTEIAAFQAAWVAAGSKDKVEVHGYASCDGPPDLNTQLSCDRAENVKTELVRQRVTGTIETFAHGETDEFGSSLDSNRQVIITSLAAPVPKPCPPCPEDPRTAGCPPCAAPPAPPSKPVFFCNKPITGSVLHRQGHAFFRIGGSSPGNPTFELEHDDRGDHCACGFQGIPQKDYQEDADSTDATCIAAPSISDSCLAANWNTYPVGKYCALGPNSNTYARFLAEKCGGTGVRPPGNVQGFDDSPPKAGTANDTVSVFTLRCNEIDCNDQSCLPPAPLSPRQQQVDCVKGLGLCGIPGGSPSPENIRDWNKECSGKTGYDGPDLTTEECGGQNVPGGSSAVEKPDAGETATAVMRAHTGSPIGSSCSCAAGSEECQECRQKQGQAIARKAASPPPPAVSLIGIEHALRSPGEPLDPPTRAFFEPRFGRDFSAVRVHSGPEAQQASAGIQAHAFTAGRDIFFASGQYTPQSESGRRLLAHELTHTIQLEPRGLGAGVSNTFGSERATRSATHAAGIAVSEPVCSHGAGHPAFQRQPDSATASARPGLTLNDIQPGSGGYEIPALLAPYTKLKLRAPQVFDSFEHTAWQHQVSTGTFALVDLTRPEAIESQVPVRTLVEPQVPASLSGSLRERMWPIVSDTAPAAEDVAPEILNEIASRWSTGNQQLLDSMVRIRLDETPAAPAPASAQNPVPLKSRPVLRFDIDGEPIRTADGSLPLLDLDPLGSNDLESIVAAVQHEAMIVAQAGDLYRASQKVVATEIDWWDGARSNWDKVSRDEVQAHAQIFSFDLNVTPVRTPLGLSVALFLSAFPEYSDVLGEMGAQVLELQQQVNKDVDDFEQYFDDPVRRGELRTFKQGKADTWQQARDMWDESVGEGVVGYSVAGLTSGLYYALNTLSGGYLETHGKGVEAWEAGHISMDQLNALSEAAMWRGLAVGVVTVAVTIATAGLAGPAAGTAVSLGQKALTAGLVGFTSTLGAEVTGTAISAGYNFRDPTTQGIWKESVHSPGQILAASALGGALGAASVPAGVIFGKMVSTVRGAFRTAQVAAPAAGEALAAAPGAAVVSTVEAPAVAGGDLAAPSATAAVDQAGSALVPAAPTAPIPNLRVPGWEVEQLGDGTYRLTRPDVPGEVIVTGEAIRYQVPAGTVGEVPIAEEAAAGQIAAEAQPRPALPPAAAESSTRVWVNRRSGVYHLPDSRWYGATAASEGEYMTLAAAEQAGFRRAGVRAPSGVYSVTRPPAGDIRVEIQAWIQPSQPRRGFEREMASAAEYGLEHLAGMERGHTTGGGIGAEAREAIRLETRFVNQQLKNHGVERTIRETLPMLSEGDRLHLTTATQTHAGTLRLKMVEYHLEIVRPDQTSVTVFQASIEQGLTGVAKWEVEPVGLIARDLAPDYSAPARPAP